MSSVRLEPFGRAAMLALIEGDLDAASARAGIRFTPFFVSDEIAWLWPIRAEQIVRQPESEHWVANAVIDDGTGAAVGHAGFHGPPDQDGLVEINYTIDPEQRRRGYASAAVAALLARAAQQPRVVTVRASISPGNVASLATIAAFGFVQNGEQWDEEDGLELLFDRAAR